MYRTRLKKGHWPGARLPYNVTNQGVDHRDQREIGLVADASRKVPWQEVTVQGQRLRLPRDSRVLGVVSVPLQGAVNPVIRGRTGVHQAEIPHLWDRSSATAHIRQ